MISYGHDSSTFHFYNYGNSMCGCVCDAVAFVLIDSKHMSFFMFCLLSTQLCA